MLHVYPYKWFELRLVFVMEKRTKFGNKKKQSQKYAAIIWHPSTIPDLTYSGQQRNKPTAASENNTWKFSNQIAVSHLSGNLCLSIMYSPFNSQDLIVKSPLWLLHISLKISYENLVLDQDNNFYLISLNILISCLLDNLGLL